MQEDTDCESLLKQIADEACERIARQTIEALKRRRVGLYGHNGYLANAWEEVCAQLQMGGTPEPRSALDYAGFIIEGGLERTDRGVLIAIWHQTPLGSHL
ncbi:MAG: hypothetical protein ACYCYF_03925, partial [Anaerolineae bacterium]